MNLVLLGTNGYAPTDEGQTSCYMLPELGIILDAGSGLYRISQHLQTSSLDIFLSHADEDHTLGLAYLFAAILRKRCLESEIQLSDEILRSLLQSTGEFVNRVRVHAAPPVLAAMREKPDFENTKWQWRELDAEKSLPAGGTLTSFPLEHTSPCFGFRLEWPGRSMAYVTDTVAKPDATYIDSIQGVDLLLHECYASDRLAKVAEQAGHSHITAVAQVAAAAQVGRLILIHHNTVGDSIDGSELESARAIFPTTAIGLDGMGIEF